LGKPYASILIDTYNHEKFIEQAIASALEQDFPASEREIIVVDDESTDRTGEIVRKFEPQLRYLHKQNGGQASALNAGIPECRGEIVAFLDGDDWWEREKLGTVANDMEAHPETGTVGHGIFEADETGRRTSAIAPERLYESKLRNAREGREFLPLRAFLGTSRLTLRKAVALQALPLPAELRIEADEFLATVTTAIGGARVLPEALTNYRIHAGNLFQFSRADAAKGGVKHEALAAIVRELPAGLTAAGVQREVIEILTRAVHVDAERMRLSLGDGWPWETVRVEREAFRKDYPEAPAGYRLFHFAVLCLAALTPPRMFYELRGHYAARNLKRFRSAVGDAAASGSEVFRKISAS